MLAKRTVLGLTAGVCRLAGEVLSEAAGVGGGDGAAGQLHVEAEGLQDAEDLAAGSHDPRNINSYRPVGADGTQDAPQPFEQPMGEGAGAWRGGRRAPAPLPGTTLPTMFLTEEVPCP